MFLPVSAICGLMLLVAIGPWPYAYYMLLRVVVFAGGIYCGVSLVSRDRPAAVGLFVLAALFNPIVPVHLTRPIWMFLNLGGAGVFAYAASRFRRH